MPLPDRTAPAYLVHTDEVDLQLDCGSGSCTSLLRAGVRLERLTGLALTHHHLDHTADLAAHLFALSNPVHPPRVEDLPIWGPEGTSALLAGMVELYGPWVRPRIKKVRVSELHDGQSMKVGDLTVTAFQVQHSGTSLAYRLEHQGRSACYSGDSGPCEGLERAADGVDLFICECAALEEDGYKGHLKASEVGRIAAAARCGRVVLTHLYPHVVDSDPAERVRANFDGPVELAADGMELTP